MGIAFWFPSAAMFYMSIAASALGPCIRASRRQPHLPRALIARRDLDRARHQPRRRENRQMDGESRRRRRVVARRAAGRRRVDGLEEARPRDAVSSHARLQLGHDQFPRHHGLRDDRIRDGRADGRRNPPSEARSEARRMDRLGIHHTLLRGHNDGAAGRAAPGEHQRTQRTRAGGRLRRARCSASVAPSRHRLAGDGDRHRPIRRPGLIRIAHAVRRRSRSPHARGLRKDSSALGHAVCFDPGVRRARIRSVDR